MRTEDTKDRLVQANIPHVTSLYNEHHEVNNETIVGVLRGVWGLYGTKEKAENAKPKILFKYNNDEFWFDASSKKLFNSTKTECMPLSVEVAQRILSESVPKTENRTDPACTTTRPTLPKTKKTKKPGTTNKTISTTSTTPSPITPPTQNNPETYTSPITQPTQNNTQTCTIIQPTTKQIEYEQANKTEKTEPSASQKHIDNGAVNPKKRKYEENDSYSLVWNVSPREIEEYNNTFAKSSLFDLMNEKTEKFEDFLRKFLAKIHIQPNVTDTIIREYNKK